ncbi:hypothetical protein [Azorhizobium doebereinerae]|uniref:hypothetical protein n=1 Tax=Azorhizobium doebereinerae TaxID=281091 RepID=UPI00041374FA|nr:hypothetical protein [Azorhizobium doebereinerae]
MPSFSPLQALSRALAALGRRGTLIIAGSVFIGLAVPPLAALAKPLLMPGVFIMLVISFMRTDLARLRAGRHVGLALMALVWIMGALPVLLGLAIAYVVPPADPDILLALVLQVAAPPIMSAPAFAALMGFDPAVSLLLMVAAMLVTPLTAPMVVATFSGMALTLDPLSLALRLGLVLAGTAGLGFALRRVAGPARIGRWQGPLDGINVILLLILAVAFMDGVTAHFLAQPGLVLAIAALAFGLSFGALAVTALLFRSVTDAGQALMIGFSAGHRNMLVLIAAAGGVIPDGSWLYVGLAQFPIYLLPYLLRPIASRIHRRAKTTSA